MTERMFLTTSEAVGEICELLREFGTLELEGRRVQYSQDPANPDGMTFMGIATGNIPWSIRLNLATLRPGQLSNVRDALARQLQEQRQAKVALEQRA
jgi:hypothetical protein